MQLSKLPASSRPSLFLLCFLLLPLFLFAQRTLTGSVSSSDGEPLCGATVKVKEVAGLGTVSDPNGHFSLTLPALKQTTLTVSMVGMETRQLAVDSSTASPLAIVLKPLRRTLETVVVTATRTPKLLKDVPVVTRVISSEEIQSLDLSNVQDLLQAELPGIEFSYSMNQQVSLNMQGFGGNSVLFLVDGERLAGETLDNIDYSRLNLDGTDHVEIVKGAASSLYGSNAVGGVVNLISHTSEKPWSLNINGRYGSHNDLRYGGSLGFNHKWANSTTHLQLTSCNPIRMKADGDFGTVYGNRTLNAKQRFVLSPADYLKFTLRAGYFFRERESQATSFDRYRDFSGGAKADIQFPSRATSASDAPSLSLAYAFDQYDKSDFATASASDVRDYSNVQHTLRGIYTHPFSNHHTLTAGGDFMRDYLMSYQFAADSPSHLQYTSDAFAQWEWSPSKRWDIIAAARYDHFSEAAASHFSPKLNIMYKLDHASLRASYANGFRAPTLKEMYMNFDMANIFMIYGNPDLLPEESHNFNLTAERQFPTTNAQLTLMAFHNRVANRISTLWSQAAGGMVYENQASTYISGFDFSASARLDCGLGGRLSCVYTHIALDEDGLRSADTRPFSATLRIDYSHSWPRCRLSLALGGRLLSRVTADEYVSLTDLSQTQKRTYPAYTLWKLTANLRLNDALTLTAAVDNLFNYVPDYYYSNSPATTGTTLSCGLSFDVDKPFQHH